MDKNLTSCIGGQALARSVTGQLADATGDFACLVFVLLAASRDRELSMQTASWQSASWRIRELSSYRSIYANPASSLHTAGKLQHAGVYLYN